MPFAPAGLITLTTDFGATEPFAGIMHGRILARFATARIVDLSHGVPPGRADLAGFWLGRAWLDFPPGTLHVAVVDPGVGTTRGVLLALCGRAPAAGTRTTASCRRRCAVIRRYAGAGWTPGFRPASDWLRCRALSTGATCSPRSRRHCRRRAAAEDFGTPVEPADPAPLPVPRRDADGVLGRVLVADHFGNLITNIDAELFASCRQPASRRRSEWPLLPTYGSAGNGAALALINAFGLVELALNGGSAAAALGIGAGAPVRVREGITA
jgi:S-adenosyl-L-methionine hydrolase (adenosine-forming)